MFMKSSVTYLGYVIDADGLYPLNNRVEAIQEVSFVHPTPLPAPEERYT